MKKVVNFFKDNLILIFLIASILHFNILSTIVYRGITYQSYSRSYISMLIISSILTIGLMIYKRFKKEYKLQIYDLLMLLMIIFACISTIYAINPYIAFNGVPGRYEGLYMILYYIDLLYISSFLDKKKKKIVVITFIVTALYQTVYAILQITNQPFVRIARNYGYIWANGTLHNPNFYATYVLLGLSSAIGLLINSRDRLLRGILFIIVAILLIGLFISNCMSGVVGLGIVLLYSFVYCLFNKRLYLIIVLAVLIGVILILLTKTRSSVIVKDINTTNEQISEISKGNIKDNYGTNRIGLWSHLVTYIPKYWVHGCGIDNLQYMGTFNMIIVNKKYYDKAHNEYLHLLLTQGAFALGNYLLLIAVVVIRGMRNSYKNKELYLILPVLGYIVQAFFNISVIEVAPFYFMFLGLLIERNKTS